MTLPLDPKNRFKSKRLIQNLSQFAEFWARVGIMVGIWGGNLRKYWEYFHYKIINTTIFLNFKNYLTEITLVVQTDFSSKKIVFFNIIFNILILAIYSYFFR